MTEPTKKPTATAPAVALDTTKKPTATAPASAPTKAANPASVQSTAVVPPTSKSTADAPLTVATAERRLADAEQAMTRAEGRFEAATTAHKQAERDYDASGGTDRAWSAVETAASALARAGRDRDRVARELDAAKFALLTAKLEELSARAYALRLVACLDVVLPPHLEKLTALYEQLGEAERDLVAAIGTAERNQKELEAMKAESAKLLERCRLEHPDRKGAHIPFPSVTKRPRDVYPRQYVRERLAASIIPDHRVECLPASSRSEAQAADQAMRVAVVQTLRAAQKAHLS